MYAVQSALAIKRAREKRASKSGPVHQIPAEVKRDLLKPPEQKGSLTYFNVGVAFILLGTFMVSSSIIPDDILGSNWTSLIPLGLFFIILGVIMIVINQMRTRAEEKELEEYVQQRLGKSISGAPLVRSPADDTTENHRLLISTSLDNAKEKEPV
eukprot:06745.XXX_149170_148638_1 [CDS] Oithona nana genome sequencing.